MQKFSTSIRESKDNQKDDNIIGNMIKKSLNIKVNGDINHFLAENIEIEGIDELSTKLQQLIVENSRLIVEKIRYQGLDNVEKEISKYEGKDK